MMMPFTGTTVARRDVPLGLRMQALFGGAQQQLGWVFLGFGMVFVYVFAFQSEAVTWLKFIGLLNTAPGTVTGTRETGSSEGGSEHTDGKKIFAVDYTFIPQGRSTPVQGTSYYKEGGRISPYSAITVEYRAGNPRVSRIKGMRSAPFGGFAIITLLFPGIGLYLVIVSLRRGRLRLAALMGGVPAVGTITSVTDTGGKVNDKPVMRVTFTFATTNGRQRTVDMETVDPKPEWMRYERATGRHGFPDFNLPPNASPGQVITTVLETVATRHREKPEYVSGPLPRSRFEQPAEPESPSLPAEPTPAPEPVEQLAGPQEMVLYLPSDPAIAVVPAQYGRQIRVDARGNIIGANPLTGMATAILPVITMAGHGLYLLSRLFG